MKRKIGSEKFSNNTELINFWRWAYSDLLSNTERGILAEYIVAMALGVDKETRVEWDPYDLLTEDDIKVEVKSSSYIQTWKQTDLSSIRFDIRPTRLWDVNTHTYSGDVTRRSDVYVFCLFDCKNFEKANPMNFELWKFFVVKTSELNNKLGNQKTISVNAIKNLNHKKVRFNELKSAIEECFN